MNRRGLYIVCALVALLLVSCRGPRRIPRSQMKDIFYEMFLQDQIVRSQMDLRHKSDTMLVYEAIFEQHGYTTDDYLYSVRYYIQEPERMAKIMDAVIARFDGDAAAMGRQIRFQTWKDKMMAIWKLQPDTLWPHPRIRAVDSLYLQYAGDSVLLRVPADSLPFLKDSLLFAADSLRFESDSL